MVKNTHKNTKIKLHGNKILHEIFEEQVVKTPNRIALEFKGAELSYNELNEKANKLANHLKNIYRLKLGDVIGIATERGFDLVVAVIAVHKIGGVCFCVDTSYPHKRLVKMLKESKADTVLVSSDHQKNGIVQKYIVNINDKIIVNNNSNNLKKVSSFSDLAFMVYSSGSTGEAKIISLYNYGVVNHIYSRIELIKRIKIDMVCDMVSAGFVPSFAEIYVPLFIGSKLIIYSEDIIKDTNLLFDNIKKDSVSVVIEISVSMLHSYLNVVKQTENEFGKLKIIGIGGEKIKASLVKMFFDRNRTINLFYAYGQSECSGMTLYNNMNYANQLLIEGRPSNNTQVYIMNKKMKIQPPGIIGELYISGDGLAQGYFNDKKKTDAVFLPDPFDYEKKIYRTGDRARMNHGGGVEIIGRVDSQIKLRGYRIEPGEIEANIKKFRNICDCCIVAIEEKAKAAQKMCLVAYYIADNNKKIKIQKLKAFLGTRLPKYMIPTYFVYLKEFPLNKNGKLDRFKLPRPVDKDLGRSDYVASNTKIEFELVKIWQEVLKVKEIGLYDDFFNLGGNSLDGVKVVNLIQARLGELVHVSELFTSPNIFLLARKIENNFKNKIKIKNELFKKFRKSITPISSIDKMTGPKNPKALFILSPSRSGSTLLRVMLAGSPTLFSPPQLELLPFNSLRGRKKFFSGRLGFYLEGTIRAVMEIKNCNVKEAREIIDFYERKNLSIKEFYNVFQSWIGEKMLVEKSRSYILDENSFKRMEAFFDNPIYIHLSRNPYSSINSFIKNRFDQISIYENSFTRRELAELVYTTSHENINNFLKKIPGERKIKIKFEDLVGDSEMMMKKICKHFDIKYYSKMLDVYDDLSSKMVNGISPASKMIGDPNFLKHKTIESSYSDEWKKYGGDYVLNEATRNIARVLDYDIPENTVISGDNVIKKARRKQAYRLTYAQKRMFVLNKLEPTSSFYNIKHIVEILGEFYISKFEYAINEMIERHEILRTNFLEIDGNLTQRINSSSKLKINHYDLSTIDNSLKLQEKESEIRREQSATPFNLETDKLLRVTVIKKKDLRNKPQKNQYVLIIVLHHIISDGWSMGIFYNELAIIYNALLKNKKPILSKLDLQYKDYAEWEQSNENKLRLKQQEQYWLEKLSGELPVLNLPIDKPRPAIQTYRGSTEKIIIGESITKKINKLARENNTTLFLVLFTIFNLFLHKITGQDDLIVGTPSADRGYGELENNIGLFVNTLAVRSKINDKQAFNRLLSETRESFLSVLNNKDYPFEQLVEKLNVVRDMSRNSIFNVMFQSDAKREEINKFQGLKMEVKSQINNTTKFDFKMRARETHSDNIVLACEYNSDIFKSKTIQNYLAMYERVMKNVLKTPEIKISEISLISNREKQATIKQLTSKQKTNKNSLLIQDRLRTSFKKHAKRIAIEYGNKKVTYNELDQRSDYVLKTILNLKAKKQLKIVLLLENKIDLVASILGILKAGHIFVPLEVDNPEERLALMLEKVDARYIITDNQKIGDKLSKQYNIIVINDIYKNKQLLDSNLKLPKYNLDDSVYIYFTSGSTGVPKAVLGVNKSLTHFVNWEINEFKLNKNSRISHITSQSFNASLRDIFVPLLLGATMCAPGNRNQVLTNDGFSKWIKTSRISVLHTTPSVFKLIKVSAKKNNEFSNLKYVVLAGEKMHPSELVHWRKEKTKIVLMYGSTESTMLKAFHLAVEQDFEKNFIPVGVPIADTKLLVLDNNLKLCPKGVIGEIYISSPYLSLGYYKDKRLNDKTFIHSLFDQKHKLYKTGDLAKLHIEGDMEIIGRRDHQVKIRGVRIELGEIETSIKKHINIKQVIVVATKLKLKNQKEDNNDKYLVAYYTTDNKKQIKTQALIEQLKKDLPVYMIPSVFIYLKKIPLNKNGKLDRLNLPTLSEKDLDKHNYEAPKTAVEKKLAKMWQEVLGVKRVGLRDNFFELGGHSLKAINLLSRVNNMYNINMSFRRIFEHSSLEQMSDYVENKILNDNIL